MTEGDPSSLRYFVAKKIQLEYDDCSDIGGLLFDFIQEFFSIHPEQDLDDYVFISLKAAASQYSEKIYSWLLDQLN